MKNSNDSENGETYFSKTHSTPCSIIILCTEPIDVIAVSTWMEIYG